MITKAVIPIAGFGYRMGLLTEYIPKEMYPLGPVPVIHKALLEALLCGITDLYIVTRKGKEIVTKYIEASWPLKLTIVNQTRTGLGGAILSAADLIKEDFAVILPDELIAGQLSLETLIKRHETGTYTLGVQSVSSSEAHKYGIVYKRRGVGTKVVEKPSFKITSPKAIIGRYILRKDVFRDLVTVQEQTPDHLELQLTPVFNDPKLLTIVNIKSKRIDAGSIEGYKKAVKYYG